MWPQLIAWPLAVFAVWVAISLLFRAKKLRDEREKDAAEEARATGNEHETSG